MLLSFNRHRNKEVIDCGGNLPATEGVYISSCAVFMQSQCKCAHLVQFFLSAKSLQLSDSVRPHRRQPTRLPRPWDSPGKNTGVGCHFLLQCMKVKVKSLSRVRLFATPWAAAYQAPLSMGFSRQEYWSGLPFLVCCC